jgi:hypothetical protein
MKKFRVFLKDKETQIVVEADKVEFDASRIVFTKENETVAEFRSDQIQGYKID